MNKPRFKPMPSNSKSHVLSITQCSDFIGAEEVSLQLNLFSHSLAQSSEDFTILVSSLKIGHLQM